MIFQAIASWLLKPLTRDVPPGPWAYKKLARPAGEIEEFRPLQQFYDEIAQAKGMGDAPPLYILPDEALEGKKILGMSKLINGFYNPNNHRVYTSERMLAAIGYDPAKDPRENHMLQSLLEHELEHAGKDQSLMRWVSFGASLAASFAVDHAYRHVVSERVERGKFVHHWIISPILQLGAILGVSHLFAKWREDDSDRAMTYPEAGVKLLDTMRQEAKNIRDSRKEVEAEIRNEFGLKEKFALTIIKAAGKIDGLFDPHREAEDRREFLQDLAEVRNNAERQTSLIRHT